MSDLVGKAPIFPLPGGALLPGQLLPLHIFEPRYRRMLDVVRKGDRMLSIATLLNGWSVDALGNPPVHEIVGVGRLVKDKPNADGTSDIVLHGVVRGEITREIPGHPFRQALVLLHPEIEVHPAVSYRLRRHLLSQLAGLLGARVAGDVTNGFHPGALVDRIAVSLDLDTEQRVAFMRAIEPEQRIDLLLALLQGRKHRQKVLGLIPTLSEFSLYLQDEAP